MSVELSDSKSIIIFDMVNNPRSFNKAGPMLISVNTKRFFIAFLLGDSVSINIL